MRHEDIKTVCEKFVPAFRGWGKTNTVMALFFLQLYGCMETNEEKTKFRKIIEDIYDENNG